MTRKIYYGFFFLVFESSLLHRMHLFNLPLDSGGIRYHPVFL